jgi:ABC-type amino acid transport system permease subunit
VGVAELTYKTQELNLQYAEAIPAFIVATILYMVVSFGGAGAGGWLERKVATRR